MAGFQEVLTDKFYDKTERDINGYKYYIIPTGSIIYRGDTQLYLENKNTDFVKGQKIFYFDSNQTNPLFFAKEKGVAEKYGIVFEFEVTGEYKLLAIDDHETIQNLYDRVGNNMRLRDVLDFNYGRETGIRLTDMDDDKVLCKWLCENGFEGYAANQMPSTKEGTIMIHRELMICDPKNIEFVKVYKKGINIDDIISEHKLRKISTQQKKSRTDTKKKKQYTNYNYQNKENDNSDYFGYNYNSFNKSSPTKLKFDEKIKLNDNSFSSPAISPMSSEKKGKRLMFMDDDDEFRTPVKNSRLFETPEKISKSLFGDDDFDGGKKRKKRNTKKNKKNKRKYTTHKKTLKRKNRKSHKTRK